jgi:hypothetical protein
VGSFDWYSSIAGIVALTIVLVEIVKRSLGSVAWLSQVPTWLYAVLISAGLTAVTHIWLGTLQGTDLDLFSQAIGSAAIASGIKEWLSNINKPLSASTAARTQRGELP